MKLTRRLAIIIGVVVVIAIIVLAVLIQISTTIVLKQGQATLVHSDFTFNNQRALSFFQNLSTPSGLLRVYPSSNIIYLSDDQQLDYNALLRLGDYVLADNISSAMSTAVGGLYGSFNSTGCTYGNWNGVDVVLGMYMNIPCRGLEWNTYSGFDAPAPPNTSKLLGNGSGAFSIYETFWGGQMGGGYVHYADLDLYYCLNELHYGDYVNAVQAFENVNAMWNGHGFADRNFQTSNEYTSYELALDLIVFQALMNNNHTEGSVVSYKSTLSQVQSIMSVLQAPNGGVFTNYEISSNSSSIMIPSGVTENGETTSLFVLAE